MMNRIHVLFSVIFAFLLIGRVAASLVVYYPFNGNADDKSGSNHHATVYGATLTADRFGNSNSAYRFDGVDDYLSPGPMDFPVPVTLSLWLKSDVVNSVWHTLFGWNHVPEPYGFQVFADGQGHIEFRLGNDTKIEKIADGDGRWHHVAATRGTDDTVRLYLDGTLERSYFTDVYNGTGHTLYLGRSFQPDQYFNGCLDDIAVFDRALSSPEIQDLYQDVYPRPVLLVPVTSPSHNVRPLFKWFRHDSISVYRLILGDKPALSDPLISIPVSDTFYRPTLDLPSDTFYWKVGGFVNRFWSGLSSFIILPGSEQELRETSARGPMLTVANPVHPGSAIQFSVGTQVRTAGHGDYILNIYNSKGVRIQSYARPSDQGILQKTVFSGQDLSGQKLAAGIYVCVLKTGNAKISRKLVLVP